MHAMGQAGFLLFKLASFTQLHPQNFPRSLFCSVFLTHQLALLGEIVPIEEALKLFHPVLQHILWHLRNNKSVNSIDMLE